MRRELLQAYCAGTSNTIWVGFDFLDHDEEDLRAS
jgi:hypothetical protein